MRGMFSAGVFEAFMQKELIFPHIVGVSAGACNIVSYMSQQPLRTRRVIQNYVGDKRYCSLSNWLRTNAGGVPNTCKSNETFLHRMLAFTVRS